jgi:hypothetical protein
MAVALIRAIIAAADKDRDEVTVLLIHRKPVAVIAPCGHERRPARQRHRYYLAHLNAHRVIYSQRPPPAEPPLAANPFDPGTRLRAGCMSRSCATIWFPL